MSTTTDPQPEVVTDRFGVTYVRRANGLYAMDFLVTDHGTATLAALERAGAPLSASTARTQTGRAITYCAPCGFEHPVTRRHCVTCRKAHLVPCRTAS